ncbi:MAG: hypothetical protein NVS3B1_17790 [Marmoricola sp.]
MSTPMAVAKAAEFYLTHQPIVDMVSKELEESKRILKRHFQNRQRPTYKGITYSESTFEALDVGLARLALGPSKTAECTVTRRRECLTLPAHLRRGAILLGESRVG